MDAGAELYTLCYQHATSDQYTESNSDSWAH